MTNGEGRMSNEGILSILNLKKMENSDTITLGNLVILGILGTCWFLVLKRDLMF